MTDNWTENLFVAVTFMVVWGVATGITGIIVAIFSKYEDWFMNLSITFVVMFIIGIVIGLSLINEGRKINRSN